MNVFSKLYDNNEISEKLEKELYPLRTMIITTLCSEITKSIYYSDREFYNTHIKNNKAFDKIIKYIMSKCSKSRLSFYKQLDDKRANLMLILFVLEEFIFAWTSKHIEFKLENVAEQMEVFRLYIKEVDNVEVKNYDLHVPMLIREKPVYAITFQQVYIMAIVLMHKEDVPYQITNHIETVIRYYEEHQSIKEIVGPFDEEYLILSLTQMYISYNIPHYIDLNLFSRLKNFKLDIYKLINMLIYVWVVYNPYTLKEYNKLLTKMFNSTIYEILNTSDKYELIKLSKRQYEIAHAKGNYKYIQIVKKIQDIQGMSEEL